MKVSEVRVNTAVPSSSSSSPAKVLLHDKYLKWPENIFDLFHKFTAPAAGAYLLWSALHLALFPHFLFLNMKKSSSKDRKTESEFHEKKKKKVRTNVNFSPCGSHHFL